MWRKLPVYSLLSGHVLYMYAVFLPYCYHSFNSQLMALLCMVKMYNMYGLIMQTAKLNTERIMYLIMCTAEQLHTYVNTTVTLHQSIPKCFIPNPVDQVCLLSWYRNVIHPFFISKRLKRRFKRQHPYCVSPFLTRLCGVFTLSSSLPSWWAC